MKVTPEQYAKILKEKNKLCELIMSDKVEIVSHKKTTYFSGDNSEYHELEFSVEEKPMEVIEEISDDELLLAVDYQI